MIKEISFQIAFCLLALGLSLYSFIDQQNDVTELRMQLPTLSKELRTIQEENMRLQYQIDQFENPQHLMDLARQSEFSHLKHPLSKEIVTLEQGLALQVTSPEASAPLEVSHTPALATTPQ
jgi:hypothetical protein